MTTDKAKQLSFSDWRYLLCACKELLVARLAFVAAPASILKRVQFGNAQQTADQTTIDLVKMCWALRTAASFVPWRSDCLVAALAGQRWLAREGHGAEISIGVASAGEKGFSAHAWLTIDGVILTGETQKEYTPIVGGEVTLSSLCNAK